MRYEGAGGRTILVGGRERLAFCGCDYLGLAHDPEVLEAAREELLRSGLSAGAARGTTGNHAAHEELEEALARWTGSPATLLVGDGFLADLALLEALAAQPGALPRGAPSWIDEEAHASLRVALDLAGLQPRTYRSAPVARDLTSACLLATDGVYPQAARVPDLSALRGDLDPHAWLVVDDSHGLGTLGAGRGSVAAAGLVGHPRVAWTASLAKALGGVGGVVAGPPELIERARASSAHATTTPIPPAVARALCTALACLRRDPDRLARLEDHRRWLSALARELGVRGRDLPLPVLGLVPASAPAGHRIAAALEDADLHVPYTEYAGDPRPGSFRVVLRVPHSDEDRERLAAVLRSVQAELLPAP